MRRQDHRAVQAVHVLREPRLEGVSRAGDGQRAAQRRRQVLRAERRPGAPVPGGPAAVHAADREHVLPAGRVVRARLPDHMRPGRDGRGRVHTQRQVGPDHAGQQPERGGPAGQPVRPDHTHGVGRVRRRGLLHHRGPQQPRRGRVAGQEPGRQGVRVLDRAPVLRRHRQLVRLREQDMPHDRGRVPEAGPGHRRPAGDQLEEAQVAGQEPARRRRVPAVPGLRRGAQLSADVHDQHAGAAPEARPEGPLELHAHDPPAPGPRPGDRGQDAAQPPGLLEPVDAEGRDALSHLQEAPVLHILQSVFPAGHLLQAVPSQVRGAGAARDVLRPRGPTPVGPSAKVPRHRSRGDRKRGVLHVQPVAGRGLGQVQTFLSLPQRSGRRSERCSWRSQSQQS